MELLELEEKVVELDTAVSVRLSKLKDHIQRIVLDSRMNLSRTYK